MLRALKTTFPVLVFAALGASRSAAAEPPAPPDFLHAIRLVESGDRYDTPQGKGGELGPYQFQFMVWQQYTTAPFSQAETPFADKIAARHYLWIAHRLQISGVPATSWNIAAAWNCGVRRVVSGQIPFAARDYATRVVNLMESEAAVRRSPAPAVSIASAAHAAAP